jgi:hypothetical protein
MKSVAAAGDKCPCQIPNLACPNKKEEEDDLIFIPILFFEAKWQKQRRNFYFILPLLFE